MLTASLPEWWGESCGGDIATCLEVLFGCRGDTVGGHIRVAGTLLGTRACAGWGPWIMSLASGTNVPNPYLPMVYAMPPKAPIGASNITLCKPAKITFDARFIQVGHDHSLGILFCLCRAHAESFG